MPSTVRVTLLNALNALNAMIHGSSETRWDLIGGVARELRTPFQAEEVSRDRMEKGLAESVYGEKGDDGGCFDACASQRRSVGDPRRLSSAAPARRSYARIQC